MITVENKKTDKIIDFVFKEKYSLINPYDYLPVFQKEDWYVQLAETMNEFFHSYTGNEKKPKDWLKKREEIVKMVDELLRANLVSLGTFGKNHDAERQTIDHAILHHTSTKHSVKQGYIEALCLLRLYAKAYSNKLNSEYGKPIWSNHIMNGKQTFMPYHYLIRRDGTFERCLEDGMIGWHSGNWEMNCRSIAICFLDDLENSKPTEKAMQTAANILKRYKIDTEKVKGHKEINPQTTCPGKKFAEWKYPLLNLASQKDN